MLFSKVLGQVLKVVQSVVNQVEAQVKRLTKPTYEGLIDGTVTDLVNYHP